MKRLPELFENNRVWAARKTAERPSYFADLVAQQTPRYMWIGCSDSRVPATEICGLSPGEIFVHRNVANLMVHSDLNCLSVLQYAIDVLEVSHVIVCGHYGCGGVAAALGCASNGLIDNWLAHIQDVYTRHRPELAALPDGERANRLCELNVIAQVKNVCYTTVVRQAWRRGQGLAVHGWIYGLHDGRLKDLGLCVERPEDLPEGYQLP